MTVRSPARGGRVTAIRLRKDVDWSQFVVRDHRRHPGTKVVSPHRGDQHGLLATATCAHGQEPVILLRTRRARRCAARVRSVEVVSRHPCRRRLLYRPLPSDPNTQSDNVINILKIEKAMWTRALAGGSRGSTGTYETARQEPRLTSRPGDDRQLWGDVLWLKGSMSCPDYDSGACQHAIARDETRVA